MLYRLVTFILAMNVFEFLFITLPYILGFLYLVFQLLDLYFHILHIAYLSRTMSTNQKSSCKWVFGSMISSIKSQRQYVLIQNPQKINQNIFRVLIGMSTVSGS